MTGVIGIVRASGKLEGLFGGFFFFHNRTKKQKRKKSLNVEPSNSRCNDVNNSVELVEQVDLLGLEGMGMEVVVGWLEGIKLLRDSIRFLLRGTRIGECD